MAESLMNIGPSVPFHHLSNMTLSWTGSSRSFCCCCCKSSSCFCKPASLTLGCVQPHESALWIQASCGFDNGFPCLLNFPRPKPGDCWRFQCLMHWQVSTTHQKDPTAMLISPWPFFRIGVLLLQKLHILLGLFHFLGHAWKCCRHWAWTSHDHFRGPKRPPARSLVLEFAYHCCAA